MKKIIAVFMMVFCFCAVLSAKEKPEWVTGNAMLYGRDVYEGKTLRDDSKWSYAVGKSRYHATERSAREDAQMALKLELTRSIADELTGDLDFTEYFKGKENDIQNKAIKYEGAINASFSMKVPPIEFLEYYVEEVEADGEKGYMVHVFGRYLTKNLFGNIEKIDIGKIVKKASEKFEEDTGEKISEDVINRITIQMKERKVEYMETRSR